MTTKTIIHDASFYGGMLYLEYDMQLDCERVYLKASAGGFEFRIPLKNLDCRQLGEALMKAAFAMEAEQPQQTQVGQCGQIGGQA